METIDRFEGEYRFLSNFYPAQIEYEGLIYPTIEHAFQAAKTLDIDARRQVASASTPGVAKRVGRQIKLREDWELVKNPVMMDVVSLKFSEGSNFAEWLIETEYAPLVEGNTWHDQYWGNCTCGRSACEPHGGNTLGKILMYRRFALMGSF